MNKDDYIKFLEARIVHLEQGYEKAMDMCTKLVQKLGPLPTEEKERTLDPGFWK